MSKRLLLAIFETILACIPLVVTPCAVAEDEQGRFSLDYGNLTPSRTSPKAQQFGQLTAKYRLGSAINFKPYVGTGLAYSYKTDINPGATTKIRTGVAGQAGFSVLLDKKSSLNFDYKFFDLAPDIERGNSSSTPQSVGVGLEIKF